jgi:DnaB-like helicase C terminal domain
MPDERLTRTLQENALTLLVWDDVNGKVVANLVDPNLFEGDYAVIAEKAIDYWRQHNQAPKQHAPDLVSDILDDPHNRKAPTFRRMLIAMLALSETINAAYVLSKLGDFVMVQKMKGATLRAAEELNARQELAIEDVKTIWNEMLRARDVNFDPGLRLNEVGRVVEFLKKQYGEFSTGIEELDNRHIVPFRAGVMLFIGGAGTGKSWFMIAVGRRALQDRKRVVHISLEMGQEEMAARYYQSIFSLTKRQTEIEVATMDFDRFNQLKGFSTRTVRPDFTFEHPDLQMELEARVEHFGERFGNLVIKRFPPSALTMDGLRAYLDNLEISEGFIPDLAILENIGLMKTDPKNPRISLGRAFQDFRGVCVERNMAGVAAHQASKAGVQARQVRSTHAAEDWSLIGTADQVVTFSGTDAERRLGLGRLYVDKSRNEADKFGVLLVQSYDLGQFCIQSALMPSKYWDLMPKDAGEEDEDDDD